MGFFAYKTLKAIFLPPGIFVIILLILAFLSKNRLGFFLGIFSSFFLFTLSSELGTRIMKPLILENGDKAERCSYVVVFGAGVSDESIRRVMEGCRISKNMGCALVVSGFKSEARFMGDIAKSLGCEVSIYDSLSRNTKENVKFARKLDDHILIISSDYHIKRIKRLLSKEGLRASVIGVSLPYGEESLLKWLPSSGKLYENLKFLNELFAILFLL